MDVSLSGSRRAPLPFNLPLWVLAGLCAVFSYAWILVVGLEDVTLLGLPLLLLGGLTLSFCLLDQRVGLALLTFAIGVSPEFSVWGIQNIRLEDFLFPVVFLGWLFRMISRNERLQTSDLKGPIIATLFISALSSVYNSVYSQLDLVSCGFRLAKSIEYFLIFLMTMNVLRRREDLRAFAYLMPMVAALVGVYGITQALHSQHRVTGPVGETSNILGGYYVLHICLALGLVAAGARCRPALLGAVALMVVPLLYTMSRTSYLSLLAGLLAMMVVRKSGWIAFLLGTSTVAMLAFTGIAERFMTIFEAVQGQAPESLVWRVRGWRVFLDYLAETPLLGQGIGNISLGAFDNEYVRQLFELGLLGLSSFAWLFFRILRTALNLSKRSSDPEVSGFALGAFGATSALLVHSLGATTFTTIRTSEPFFLAVGILYAMSLEEDGERPYEERLPAELPALPGRSMRAPL